MGSVASYRGIYQECVMIYELWVSAWQQTFFGSSPDGSASSDHSLQSSSINNLFCPDNHLCYKPLILAVTCHMCHRTLVLTVTCPDEHLRYRPLGTCPFWVGLPQYCEEECRVNSDLCLSQRALSTSPERLQGDWWMIGGLILENWGVSAWWIFSEWLTNTWWLLYEFLQLCNHSTYHMTWI